MQIAARTNADQVVDDIDRFVQACTTKVPAAVANELADRAETTGVREIARIYKLPQREFRKYLSRKHAIGVNAEASITAKGAGLPLALFAPRQTRRGVSVSVKGRRFVIPHTFLATMPNGHVGVFARGAYGGRGGAGEVRGSFGRFVFTAGRKVKRGSRRHTLPINELYTYAPPDAWDHDEVIIAMQDRCDADYAKVVQQTIRRFAAAA